MAPNHADTASAAQRQAHRSVPRIIPAIPHRFSRPPASARPITPDESTTAAVTQPASEPHSAIEQEPEGHVVTPVKTPLTPDSKASAVNHSEVEEPTLASSPARSGDDHADEALDDRVSEVSAQQVAAQDFPSESHAEIQPVPAITEVNDDRTKPTAPAELPPEFHPKGKSTSHTPTVEGAEAPSHPPSSNISSHRPHPSVEGLVFGGAVQESPAMPSTPQELEPEMRLPQQTVPHPPPGFAPPHLAPQFYPGHSHHPSDPSAPWLYPAYSMAPPADGLYANGHEYHAPAFLTESAAYQAPYQAQFSPQDALPAVNGATRSHSQSPSKSQLEDTKTGSNYDEEAQTIAYTNGFASRHQETMHDGYDITKHIFGLFGNPEFTDYILHIRSQDAMFLTLPVHAAIVSRSPVVLEALRRSAPPAYRTKDPRRLADVLTNDRFVTPESLHEAIKILYAAPLLPVQSFLYGLTPYDGDLSYSFNEARKRMSQAISYAAAGRVLQVPEMQACGLQIAKALLRWDTLDQVLHFGFSAGKTTVQPSGTGADSRLLETYAIPLLDDALEFIAYNFPVDFALYTIAPELRHTPRLPVVPEFRQPSHNPRLSKIRFGDAPPEDELKPSFVTQTLSSVLVSLPLPLLDRLFSHPAAANQVGWSGLVKIMRDVIEEREKRRQKALQAQNQPSSGKVARDFSENLYREERVEPSTDHPSGFKLISTS